MTNFLMSKIPSRIRKRTATFYFGQRYKLNRHIKPRISRTKEKSRHAINIVFAISLTMIQKKYKRTDTVVIEKAHE